MCIDLMQPDQARHRAWLCRLTSVIAAALIGVGSSGVLAGPSGYHLISQVPLPQVTGWDYLSIDPQGRHLFVSDNAGIVVIDIDALSVVGTVPSPPSFTGVGLVHGVAIAPTLNRAFLSHEVPPSLMAFNLHTLAAEKITATDPGTDAVLYEPVTQRVFSFNGKHRPIHDATAIDAVTGQMLGTVPLPGVPESAVADQSGQIYVNIASQSRLGRIDAKSLRLTQTWPMAPCKEPSGLAIDPAHGRLFAGCDNHIMVMIATDTGRVVASVPSGEGTDANAFDPGTGLAFSSNGEDGTLTVAHEDSPDKLTLVENVKTAPGARTMALDSTTHRVFLIAGQFGKPPAHPTAENPHGYPTAVPGSVKLLVFGP